MIPTNRRNNKNSKKKIVIAFALALVVAICAIIVTFSLMNSGEKQEQDMGISVEEQSTLQEESMSFGDESEEGIDTFVKEEKEYYINFVDLAVLHNGSGVFDIHIRFPDGEDYVVVAGKKIVDVTEEGFYVMLDDRENHMLSSAKTDSDVYVGTQMYLSRYATGMSESAKPDYPWNQYVLSAHGLDEAEAEEVYAKRMQLEENLAAFMNQTLSK